MKSVRKDSEWISLEVAPFFLNILKKINAENGYCSIFNAFLTNNAMIQILKLQGTDKQLYRLVAPLVMNPDVLKQNHNFPFRTSDNFVWFVALNRKKVIGFIPVENKREGHLINNYYVEDKKESILRSLLEEVIAAWDDERPLLSLSLIEDRAIFEDEGFAEEKLWTRYVKMRKEKK